jgi:hypothetical protein
MGNKPTLLVGSHCDGRGEPATFTVAGFFANTNNFKDSVPNAEGDGFTYATTDINYCCQEILNEYFEAHPADKLKGYISISPPTPTPGQ